MRVYFTIKADIHQSKRNKKYRDLDVVIENINNCLYQLYDEETVTLIKMTQRSGDEIFAVYTDFLASLDALQILLIIAKDKNIPLNIGFGAGVLDEVNSDSNIINGESIWKATSAVEKLRNSLPKYNEKVKQNLAFKVIFFEDDYENKKFQTLLFLLFEKILNRTLLQNKAVWLVRNNPDMEYYRLFDLLHGEDQIFVSSKQEDKRIKFTKFLQRAEHQIVQDLVELINTEYQSGGVK